MKNPPLDLVRLGKRHLGHVVRVGANLEFASLKNFSNPGYKYKYTWVIMGTLNVYLSNPGYT